MHINACVLTGPPPPRAPAGAHWEDAQFHETAVDAAHYGERSGSAREGLAMLMTPVEMRGMLSTCNRTGSDRR